MGCLDVIQSHITPTVLLIAVVSFAPFIGSFLGTLILRLPTERPVVFDRSRCEACETTLTWRDLVPLFSWLISRGRCRHCGARVGAFYPLIELAALAVALWAVFALPGNLAWAGAGLGWALLALAVIDARHFLLPDVLTLPLIPAGLAATWLLNPAQLPAHLLGAALGFAVFAAIAWAYRRLRGREGLGRGDAKLLAAAGAWVGWAGLPGVVVLAAVGALLTLLCARFFAQRRRFVTGVPDPACPKLSATTAVPFGPFLALGFWITWLYGPLQFG